jgi:hypothetical protein
MVSVSGVALCSFAIFAVTLTFLIGVVGVLTGIAFKMKAEVLHGDRAVNEWQEVNAFFLIPLCVY